MCPEGGNVWCSSGHTLVKVAKEHLRHATEDEIRACQIVAGELAFQSKRLAQGSERHGFLDLTSDEPMDTTTGEVYILAVLSVVLAILRVSVVHSCRAFDWLFQIGT